MFTVGFIKGERERNKEDEGDDFTYFNGNISLGYN